MSGWLWRDDTRRLHRCSHRRAVSDLTLGQVLDDIDEDR
jgi:hypothetical protein